MITKRQIATLISLVTAPLFAAPFLAIGDNAELFVTGKAQASYDDNVTLDSDNELEDEIFQFTPGLQIVYGKGSEVKGTLILEESLIAYSENTNLNTQLANIAFNSSYEGDSLNLGANASFRELSQNSRDSNVTGKLVDSENYSLGLNASLSLTEKSKVASGFQWTRVQYTNISSLVDQDKYVVPVNYYFATTPKLDLTAGVRYSDINLANSGNDSHELYYNVGAKGEFTPKLLGTFDIGYNTSFYDGSGVDDQTGLGLNSSLTYIYSPKTNIVFRAKNDFATDSTGQSNETIDIGTGISTQFTSQFSGSADVGYVIVSQNSAAGDYDFYTGSVGVSYKVNEYLTVSSNYTYQNKESDIPTSEFSKNLFVLSASVRY
jgi:polysaccharide biosynthesis protein VpsM